MFEQIDNLLANSTQFAKCPYHSKKRLDQICLEEDCSKKGLICTHCAFQEHSKHTCIPIEVFVNGLYEQFQKAHISSRFQNYFVQLEELNLEMKMQQEELQKHVVEFAEKNKKERESFINTFKQSAITQTDNTAQLLEGILNSQTLNGTEQKTLFSQLLKFIDINLRKNNESDDIKIDIVVKEYERVRKNAERTLKNMADQKQDLMHLMDEFKNLMDMKNINGDISIIRQSNKMGGNDLYSQQNYQASDHSQILESQQMRFHTPPEDQQYRNYNEQRQDCFIETISQKMQLKENSSFGSQASNKKPDISTDYLYQDPEEQMQGNVKQSDSPKYEMNYQQVVQDLQQQSQKTQKQSKKEQFEQFLQQNQAISSDTQKQQQQRSLQKQYGQNDHLSIASQKQLYQSQQQQFNNKYNSQNSDNQNNFNIHQFQSKLKQNQPTHISTQQSIANDSNQFTQLMQSPQSNGKGIYNENCSFQRPQTLQQSPQSIKQYQQNDNIQQSPQSQHKQITDQMNDFMNSTCKGYVYKKVSSLNDLNILWQDQQSLEQLETFTFSPQESVSWEQWRTISTYLKSIKASKMVKYNFSQCEIGDSGLQDICDILKLQKGIGHLSISLENQNDISIESLHQFIETIYELSSLKGLHLNFSGTKFDCDHHSSLCSNLKDLKQIQYLILQYPDDFDFEDANRIMKQELPFIKNLIIDDKQGTYQKMMGQN